MRGSGHTQPAVSLWDAWPIRHTPMVAHTTTGNSRECFVKRPGQTSMYYHYGLWHCHVSAPQQGLLWIGGVQKKRIHCIICLSEAQRPATIVRTLRTSGVTPPPPKKRITRAARSHIPYKHVSAFILGSCVENINLGKFLLFGHKHHVSNLARQFTSHREPNMLFEDGWTKHK